MISRLASCWATILEKAVLQAEALDEAAFDRASAIDLQATFLTVQATFPSLRKDDFPSGSLPWATAHLGQIPTRADPQDKVPEASVRTVEVIANCAQPGSFA